MQAEALIDTRMLWRVNSSPRFVNTVCHVRRCVVNSCCEVVRLENRKYDERQYNLHTESKV